MRSKRGMMRAAVLAAAVALAAGAAQAREFKEYQTAKYGYSLKIPAEFQLQGEDNTTTWTYQPGSAPAPAAKADGDGGGKKKKIGAKLGGLVAGKADAPAAGGGGGLEPALSIYINWTWMPDVAPGTLYKANKDSDEQNMSSPDPDYTALTPMSKKGGYAQDGSAYWYKEVDKKAGDEIHRWHIKAFGNKSSYTIGLCGTYAQFKEWGPVYEEVIKSFKLVPLEKK